MESHVELSISLWKGGSEEDGHRVRLYIYRRILLGPDVHFLVSVANAHASTNNGVNCLPVGVRRYNQNTTLVYLILGTGQCIRRACHYS
jgi:hypothetical protein